MKTTQYLYNISPKTLRSLLYEEALKVKITHAKVLIEQLLEPHYTVRDDERIEAVHKAIKFNKELLKELQ